MASNTRVTIMGLNYAPENTGIAPYTTGMATGLRHRGYDVDVVTAHPHYPAWAVAKGYGEWTRRERIDDVALKRLKHFVPRKPKGFARLVSEVSFGARLLFTRLDRPDVIVAVSPALFASALVALRVRRRVPFIVWVQDIYSLGITETGGDSRIARIVKGVEARLLRRATRVVVIHDRFANYVARELGVPPGRVEVVRNWTHLGESEGADRESMRAHHGWRSDEKVVLHAGNMGVKQGLDNVVSAARVADERGAKLRFVLVGGGSERARIEQLSRGIKRIDVLPSLDDDVFTATLKAADALLVNEKPGVSGMAVPSKLTSYFASGRPVLAATDPDGTTASELVASGAGVIVPASDPSALLDAALTLTANPEECDRLGNNGRRYRESVLTAEHAFARFDEILGAATHSVSAVESQAASSTTSSHAA